MILKRRIIKNKKKALIKYIKNHLGLIKLLSYKFSKKINSNYYSSEDLISEGIIVYYKCVEKFDDNKGIAFNSYLYISLINKFYRFYLKNSYSGTIIIDKIEIDKIEDSEENDKLIIYALNNNFHKNLESLIQIKKYYYNNLSESAQETFKALLYFNGFEGSKITRNRRMKGIRPNLNITGKELISIMDLDKTLKTVKKDIKEIRFMLKRI